MYVNGASLFAWDFSPDKCNGFHWHKRDDGGHIDIELRFKEGLAKNITIMLFAVFDALVAIDRHSVCTVSY
jgi:hypothetical protein